MIRFLQMISALMLVLTVGLPVLYLVDLLDETTMKWLMLVVTVVWFVVTPCWMGRNEPAVDTRGDSA